MLTTDTLNLRHRSNTQQGATIEMNTYNNCIRTRFHAITIREEMSKSFQTYASEQVFPTIRYVKKSMVELTDEHFKFPLVSFH